MATKKKDPCPAGQYWNGKTCVTGQDPYTYKNKEEDRKSNEINTNLKDKVFYDSMGPVPKGFTRAKFKPSFPNRLAEGDPDRYQKKGGSVGTKKPKMAMGGTKKTVIKKPLKTAMYGTAMKPTMMAKPSMMKKGGTKKKK
jgi:hypothetical protein